MTSTILKTLKCALCAALACGGLCANAQTPAGAAQGGRAISFSQEMPKEQAKRDAGKTEVFILGGESKKAPTSAKFAPMLIASLQSPSMDWWFNIPPNSVPHLAQIKKIFFGQIFSLMPFADNAQIKDGRFSISYTITATYPDGRSADFVKDVKYSGYKRDKSVIIACPDVLEAKFTEEFPKGKYIFKMTAKDEIGGESASETTSLELAKWETPPAISGKKFIDDYIRNFYLQPSPETLYSIYFSKDLDLSQKGAPNSLNYLYIGFFQTAFKRNAFLLPIIRERFAMASQLERSRTIFLFRILAMKPVDPAILTDSEKAYQEKLMRAEFPNPYESWHSVIGAAQMDMLWGEFFADGAYKPVRRIMDLLANSAETPFAEEMLAKRMRPKTKLEWSRFMLGMLSKVALITLSENASRIPLVEKYCLWAIQNRDLPEVSYKTLSPVFGESESEPANPFEGSAEIVKKYFEPKIFLRDIRANRQ